jgi:hypothetical protein
MNFRLRPLQDGENPPLRDIFQAAGTDTDARKLSRIFFKAIIYPKKKVSRSRFT